jgi:hypothetical protein
LLVSLFMSGLSVSVMHIPHTRASTSSGPPSRESAYSTPTGSANQVAYRGTVLQVPHCRSGTLRNLPPSQDVQTFQACGPVLAFAYRSRWDGRSLMLHQLQHLLPGLLPLATAAGSSAEEKLGCLGRLFSPRGIPATAQLTVLSLNGPHVRRCGLPKSS